MAISNIDKLTEQNLGGGNKLQILFSEDVDEFPDIIDENIEDNIVPITGINWTTLLFTQHTLSFSDTPVDVEGREGFFTKAAGVIPKDRLEVQQKIAVCRDKRVVCLYYSNNGTVKCIGTKKRPALMTVAAIDHKAGAAERNEYSIEITSQQGYMAPHYQGTVPGGGGGGSVAYVKNSDESINTSVAAGNTYNIPDVDVDVKDADGNVFHSESGLPGGVNIIIETDVIQFSGIVDSGPPYTNSLIDT